VFLRWTLAAIGENQPSTWALLASLVGGVIGSIVMARLSVAASGAIREQQVLPPAIVR
jgi:hypothetical protein